MKARIISITLAVLSLLTAGFCGYLCYVRTSIWWQAVIFAFAVVIAVPVCDILHETGHMFFGAIVKIKAKPEKIAGLKFWQPSNCKIIPKTDRNLKGRLIVTAAGGLVVNFALIALGVVALCVEQVPVWCAVALPASLYQFLFNAFPLYLADGKTDGAVISGLIKSDGEAKVMLAVLTAQSQILNGKTYGELDGKLLFDLPQIREDDEAFIALTQLRYEYFNAKGDGVQAEKYKKRLEQLQEYL